MEIKILPNTINKLEADWKKTLTKDDMDLDDPDIQFCLRGLYIDKIVKISFMTRQLKDAFKRIENKHYNKDTENFMIALWDIFIGEDIDQLNKEIKKLKWKLKVFTTEKTNQQIDDQMIEQAKNYPFENLIDIPKNGFISCLYHNEKTPSFHFDKKRNYFYCFSCRVSMDTIKYVMDFHNKNFIEAVKQLQ